MSEKEASKDTIKEKDVKIEQKITSVTDLIKDLMGQFLTPALKARQSESTLQNSYNLSLVEELETKKEGTETKKEGTETKKEGTETKKEMTSDIFNGIIDDLLASKSVTETNKQGEKKIDPGKMFSGLFSLGAETMYKTKYNNLMNIINFFSTVKDINAFVTYAKEHGMDIINKEDSLFSSDVDTLKFIYTKMENEDGSGVSQR